MGHPQEVLVEGPARKGKGMLVGRTRGFRKVVFPSSADWIGELVSVPILESSVSTLIGGAPLNSQVSSELVPVAA